MTPYLEVVDLMRENARLQKLVDEECRRAEDAHGMSQRQSLEIERLRDIARNALTAIGHTQTEIDEFLKPE